MVHMRKHLVYWAYGLVMILLLINSNPAVQAEPLRFTYFHVTNTNNSGAGSLHQAILDSNLFVGRDHILFNIPTTDPGYDAALGVWFIDLTTVLPILNDPIGVVINGLSQTGTHEHLPGIIIRATSSLPSGSSIFTIANTSTDNTIHHLGIFNSQGDSILIHGSQNTISENQIFNSEMYGINITTGSLHNYIHDNYLCGQKLDSIHLVSAGTNTISRNIIGLQPDYYPFAPATDGSGISLSASSINSIEDNTISHNKGHGIYLFNSPDNVIEGNSIGLSEDLQEEFGNGKFGILVQESSNSQIYDNWISGNHMDGIRLVGGLTTGSKIEKNNIGMRMIGPAPNHHHGIGIYDHAHHNDIGRDFDLAYANFIVFNGWSGVVVVNSPSGGHNFIGTNFIMHNQYYGVHINESPFNRIVSNTILNNGSTGMSAGVRIENQDPLLTDLSDHNLIKDNCINGNAGLGIELVGDANAEIIPPLISSSSCTEVTGTTLCVGCLVQIFSDSGDEGSWLEGTVITDAGGNFVWTGNLHGPNLTATLIDPTGNSSQFSVPVINACVYTYLSLFTK